MVVLGVRALMGACVSQELRISWGQSYVAPARRGYVGEQWKRQGQDGAPLLVGDDMWLCVEDCT